MRVDNGSCSDTYNKLYYLFCHFEIALKSLIVLNQDSSHIELFSLGLLFSSLLLFYVVDLHYVLYVTKIQYLFFSEIKQINTCYGNVLA